MGKTNVAEKTATVAEVVEVSPVVPTMTVVKEEKIEEAKYDLVIRERELTKRIKKLEYGGE
jgi:hypothetical protein